MSLDAEVTPLHQEEAVRRQLCQELASMKTRLAGLEHRIYSIDFEDDFQLNIERLHSVKNQLEQEKEALLQVNLNVHTCIVQHPKAPGGQVLKDNVTALYQLWDQLADKCREREAQLEDAEKTWKELQKSLNDLQADIAADQAKLQQFAESPENESSSAAFDTQQSMFLALLFQMAFLFSHLNSSVSELVEKLERNSAQHSVRLRHLVRIRRRVHHHRGAREAPEQSQAAGAET